NETRPVQMMFKQANFNMTYIGDLQTKILELPYVGNELSMIILLPDAIQDGSTGLERVSCGAECKDRRNPCRQESVTLQRGLQFSPRAIVLLVLQASRNVPLLPVPTVTATLCECCSGCVLLPWAEAVEEELSLLRSRAAVKVKCCAMRVPEFTADHPFLFFIRHNKTCSILFCGRFCCP
ncbi:ILEU inhibitor, partial [Thryothorus ludovicianus]|nr:ILEU inhibitor [Thryothorus ludovicianus]